MEMSVVKILIMMMVILIMKLGMVIVLIIMVVMHVGNDDSGCGGRSDSEGHGGSMVVAWW